MQSNNIIEFHGGGGGGGHGGGGGGHSGGGGGHGGGGGGHGGHGHIGGGRGHGGRYAGWGPGNYYYSNGPWYDYGGYYYPYYSQNWDDPYDLVYNKDKQTIPPIQENYTQCGTCSGSCNYGAMILSLLVFFALLFLAYKFSNK